MKKTLVKWLMLAGLAGPTLTAVNCATDFRDAVLSGAMDYVAATTTALLERFIYPGPQDAA